MTILTINRKGTVKFPKEVLKHLREAKHLHVRLNARGITLMPVQIAPALELKAIPSGKP